MQFSHGVSSLVDVWKVTSCLYAAARVARRFLLVLGAAFDTRKLRFAGGVWPAWEQRFRLYDVRQTQKTSDAFNAFPIRLMLIQKLASQVLLLLFEHVRQTVGEGVNISLITLI